MKKHKNIDNYEGIELIFFHNLDYGYRCLEELLQAGCTPATIYQAGSECLALMAAKIPSEDEVKEAENFLQPQQESLST